MFREEATEIDDPADVEERERVRDDAKIADLGDWKNDGVTDRNRDVWKKSWLPVEFEVMGGKTGRDATVEIMKQIQKRSGGKYNCKSFR